MLLKKIKEIYESLDKIFPDEISLSQRVYKIEKEKYKAIKEEDKQKIKYFDSLLEMIDQYKTFGLEFISLKAQSLEINEEECQYLVLLLNDLIDERNDKIDIDKFKNIYEYSEENNLLDTQDSDLFASLLLEAYIIKGKTWRGKEIAKHLKQRIEARVTKDNYYGYCNILDKLGVFYKVTRNVIESYSCLKLASSISLKFNDLKESSIYLYNALKYTNVLPKNLKPDINEEEIKSIYKEYADNILKYKEAHNLKVDPVEHTQKFQDVYDIVMEEVEKIIEKEGDLHLPHQRWGIMESEFSKRGIKWKNPALMNPGYMFD